MNYVSSNMNSTKKTNKLPTIFTYPSRTKTFTHIKSPMAHKTFSQQQFKFKFFFMSASFVADGSYNSMDMHLSSVNSALYLLTDFKLSNSIAGTNLFLLKKISLVIRSSDSNFFNFYKFLL